MLVKKYHALAVRYKALRAPYRKAIGEMDKKLWTPTRVAKNQNAQHPIKSPTAADRKFRKTNKKGKKAKKGGKKPTHFHWKRALKAIKRMSSARKHRRAHSKKKHFHWMHFGRKAEAIVPE